MTDTTDRAGCASTDTGAAVAFEAGEDRASRSMHGKVVTVFGGSGFVGRHLIWRLARHGAQVRVAVRDTSGAQRLRPMGDVGQVVPMRCDVQDEDAVRAALKGGDAAVNLVGILYERGRATFEALHHQAAGRIARLAREEGVARLAHMSALGADPRSKAAYARTKAAGEEAVRAAFPEATITRPSVIFGPEDDFFNRFGRMVALLPVVPVVVRHLPTLRWQGGPMLDVWRGGGPRFQPVYVGDVAEVLFRAVDPGRDAAACSGRIFELGGPTVMSMKDIMTFIGRVAARRRLYVPLPLGLVRLASYGVQLSPTAPPITPDQVRLMETDNVTSGDHPTFADLGMEPEAVEGLVPNYLKRFRDPSLPSTPRLETP